MSLINFLKIVEAQKAATQTANAKSENEFHEDTKSNQDNNTGSDGAGSDQDSNTGSDKNEVLNKFREIFKDFLNEETSDEKLSEIKAAFLKEDFTQEILKILLSESKVDNIIIDITIDSMFNLLKDKDDTIDSFKQTRDTILKAQDSSDEQTKSESSNTEGNTESSNTEGNTESSNTEGNTESSNTEGNTESSNIEGNTESSNTEGNTESSNADDQTLSNEEKNDKARELFNYGKGTCLEKNHSVFKEFCKLTLEAEDASDNFNEDCIARCSGTSTDQPE